jgi:hypothetical protein
MTTEQRFMAKVDVGNSPAGCWMWTASHFPTGYGQFTMDRKPVTAHRAAYELLVGPIPDGAQIDHLCRERGCVNPLHLEPVSREENLARGIAPRIGVDITHCPAGHPYDEANTYVNPRGSQICRACHRTRQAARQARLAVA